ncbi:T-complex protein 11 [Tanacetum coccineum]
MFSFKGCLATALQHSFKEAFGEAIYRIEHLKRRGGTLLSSILANGQRRLAKLDQLRQAGRSGVKVRVKKECAELGTKVKLHVRHAETNRMRILNAYRQRRATLRERTSQSLIRRVARQSKHKERLCAAISQKWVAAKKKRLGLLKAAFQKNVDNHPNVKPAYGASNGGSSADFISAIAVEDVKARAPLPQNVPQRSAGRQTCKLQR